MGRLFWPVFSVFYARKFLTRRVSKIHVLQNGMLPYNSLRLVIT